MTLEILTLLMIITGTVIIGITYYNIKKENAINVSTQKNINEAGFEEYHTELNETALDIYKELDNKYQEILVIYELIEKKYGEIKNNSNKNDFVNSLNKSITESYNNNTNINERNTQNKLEVFQQNVYEISENVNTKKNLTKDHDFSQVAKSNELNQKNDENLAMKLLDEQLKEEKATNKQSKHSDVVELIEKGFSVEQIARELNIGTGEVLLVKELTKVKNEQK